MNCTVKSLYLCVRDMERAIRFYEAYSVFDIHGFRLGLFAYEKAGEKHIFGSNCLPSLEVDSLDILKNKLSGLKIVFPLKQIGQNWVSEFEDSEGNHIELTAPYRKE